MIDAERLAPALSSFSFQRDALFPSVANGILVLIPESHRRFIPGAVCMRFDAVPIGLLVEGFEGQFKPVLLGRAILVVPVIRCREMRLIMVLKSCLVVYELIERFLFS